MLYLNLLCLLRLSNDITNVIEMLCGNDAEGEPKKEGEEGLVIITTLVTSCVRSLKQTNSKLQALKILLLLSEKSSAENILDRIIPYCVSVSSAETRSWLNY